MNEFEKTDDIPNEKGVIGMREIVKGINSEEVKEVIIANNCPENLIEKIPKSTKVKIFSGNQKELGTKLGKPFPVSAVGYI